MNFKIVRVTNLYNEYIKGYYHKFPAIKYKSFNEQQDHLEMDSCDTVTSFTKNMRDIGIEAHSIFTNAIWLQHQWKLENRCKAAGKDLIAEQIKSLQPQVVWLDDFTLIEKHWIQYLRQYVPSIKLVTGHLCAPFSSSAVNDLKALDFLITCTPCLQQEFEKIGVETFMHYHGFENTLGQQLLEDNHFDEIKLLFTGSLYTGGGFHKTRIEYIEQFLASNLPVKIYGSVDSDMRIIKKKIAYMAINSFTRLGGRKYISKMPILKRFESFGQTPVNFYSAKLKDNILPPVFGLDQFKLLSKANICFNIHGEIAKGCAGNARLFEATGVGTCLVTDWKENLADLFDLEREVVTYKSIGECIDKIKWLLEHPGEAEKIGRAGQLRTLREHTVKKRVMKIYELFKSKL